MIIQIIKQNSCKNLDGTKKPPGGSGRTLHDIQTLYAGIGKKSCLPHKKTIWLCLKHLQSHRNLEMPFRPPCLGDSWEGNTQRQWHEEQARQAQLAALAAMPVKAPPAKALHDPPLHDPPKLPAAPKLQAPKRTAPSLITPPGSPRAPPANRKGPGPAVKNGQVPPVCKPLRSQQWGVVSCQSPANTAAAAAAKEHPGSRSQIDPAAHCACETTTGACESTPARAC